MPLDLSSLRDAPVRAAAIQAFEFTFELAFKFMKRRLELTVPVPAAVDEMTFMQVVRSAAETGLVTDVSRFHAYREARNITSHSYDRAKAQQIVAELPRFAIDVAHLLAQLEARNRVSD